MFPFKGGLSGLLRANGEDLEEAIKAARELSWKHFGKRIRFYAPGFMPYKSSCFCSSPKLFPSISITGTACALKCKHCGGKLLNTMVPALKPAELIQISRDLEAKGGVGFLLSGGCLPDGSVPLEKFTEAIGRIKRDTGLKIVVHTGLISYETARKLKEAGVDAALIDVIGSNETIREVYQLDAKVEDYDRSLKALHEAEIPLVPHVLVGLHYGKIKGEFHALEMIAKHDPAAVIVIALTPIKGTAMENAVPPTPEDITRVLVAARFMLPSAPVVLGCVRPKGKHRAKTDKMAVRAGVNAIAFPTAEAIQLAESMGLETTFSPLCCSQIFEDI